MTAQCIVYKNTLVSCIRLQVIAVEGRIMCSLGPRTSLVMGELMMLIMSFWL